MAINLPKQFTNIPLSQLWEQLKVCNELKSLATSADEEAYWDGFYDAIVVLLGDLTHRPTVTRRKRLTELYQDFVMEDKLLLMEEELRDENGSVG